MAEQVETPLTREIRERMKAAGLNAKSLSLKAGLGPTYVRDILVGRSTGNNAAKLSKLAAALGVAPAALLHLAPAPDASELVKDPAELVLLRAWRELPDDERNGVLEFIRFRLSRLGHEAPVGKAV